MLDILASKYVINRRWERVTEIHIPGPGAAMAIATAVAIYSAAVANVDYVRTACIIAAFWFSLVTIFIEVLHLKLKK
jgi:hypothetical protein